MNPMEHISISSSSWNQKVARCIRTRAVTTLRAACRSSNFSAFARLPRPSVGRHLHNLSNVLIYDVEFTDSRGQRMRSRAGKHVSKTSTVVEPRVTDSPGGSSDGPGALTPESTLSTSSTSSSWLEGNLYAPVSSASLPLAPPDTRLVGPSAGTYCASRCSGARTPQSSKFCSIFRLDRPPSLSPGFGACCSWSSWRRSCLFRSGTRKRRESRPQSGIAPMCLACLCPLFCWELWKSDSITAARPSFRRRVFR